MATSKAKRPVLLAQLTPQHAKTARAGPGSQRRSTNPKPSPDPTELLPVKPHAYRAIAELNGGFDKVIQELHVLGQVSYFRPDRVSAMRYLICQIRAEANRDFSIAMHDREKVNAGYFERGGS